MKVCKNDNFSALSYEQVDEVLDDRCETITENTKMSDTRFKIDTENDEIIESYLKDEDGLNSEPNDNDTDTRYGTKKNSTDTIVNISSSLNAGRLTQLITFICDVTNCGKFYNNDSELRVLFILI